MAENTSKPFYVFHVADLKGVSEKDLAGVVARLRAAEMLASAFSMMPMRSSDTPAGRLAYEAWRYWRSLPGHFENGGSVEAQRMELAGVVGGGTR